MVFLTTFRHLFSGGLGSSGRSGIRSLANTKTLTRTLASTSTTTTVKPTSITYSSANNVSPAGAATTFVAGPFQTAAQMEVDPSAPFTEVEAARPYHPCSVFFDRTLSKFINEGTRKGEKALMREIMRDTFAIIKRTQLAKYWAAPTEEERSKIECDPLAIFHGALDNCRPLLITRSVKRGGATYQVPFPLSERDSEDYAFRWLLDCVKERPKPRKTHFPEVMARELIDCFYGEGKVVKRKQDMHKQCEANKAYAHYRWN